MGTHFLVRSEDCCAKKTAQNTLLRWFHRKIQRNCISRTKKTAFSQKNQKRDEPQKMNYEKFFAGPTQIPFIARKYYSDGPRLRGVNIYLKMANLPATSIEFRLFLLCACLFRIEHIENAAT